MNVVPARSLGVLVDGARSRGLSIERLTDDLPELQEAIARRRASVGWDDLATLIERLSDVLGGGDALRRLAEDQATAMGLPIFQVVGRALASPLDLYTVGVRWMGPSMLPMIEAEMADYPTAELLTAEEFGAEDAYRIGLVQEVVPAGQQLERALEIAQTIAEQAPRGVQETLANARIARDFGEQAAREHLKEVLGQIMVSEDAAEGVRSFLERRPAKFTGK